MELINSSVLSTLLLCWTALARVGHQKISDFPVRGVQWSIMWTITITHNPPPYTHIYCTPSQKIVPPSLQTCRAVLFLTVLLKMWSSCAKNFFFNHTPASNIKCKLATLRLFVEKDGHMKLNTAQLWMAWVPLHAMMKRKTLKYDCASITQLCPCRTD